jgi:hypothetical protein
MATPSKASKALDAYLEQIDRRIADPATPSYVFDRLVATATRIRLGQEKLRQGRLLARKARDAKQDEADAAEARAKSDAENMPDNGRSPFHAGKPSLAYAERMQAEHDALPEEILPEEIAVIEPAPAPVTKGFFAEGSPSPL